MEYCDFRIPSLHLYHGCENAIIANPAESADLNAGNLRSLAADRGYDAKFFRDELRENSIRPLIKHRIMNPLDHANNARMNSDRYHQLSTEETVFSSIKRTLGSAVRARIWWLKFREMLLKAVVYNLR